MEYEAFLIKDRLTLAGLQQTYDDGIGNVDTDYDTLGLSDWVRCPLTFDPGPSVRIALPNAIFQDAPGLSM